MWDANAVLNYVGRRPDIDFSKYPSPTITLDPYARLDVAGGVSLDFARLEGWSATWRTENVTGKKYQEVLGFAAPGRSVLVGLRWGSKAR